MKISNWSKHINMVIFWILMTWGKWIWKKFLSISYINYGNGGRNVSLLWYFLCSLYMWKRDQVHAILLSLHILFTPVKMNSGSQWDSTGIQWKTSGIWNPTGIPVWPVEMTGNPTGISSGIPVPSGNPTGIYSTPVESQSPVEFTGNPTGIHWESHWSFDNDSVESQSQVEFTGNPTWNPSDHWNPMWNPSGNPTWNPIGNLIGIPVDPLESHLESQWESHLESRWSTGIPVGIPLGIPVKLLLYIKILKMLDILVITGGCSKFRKYLKIIVW